MIGLFKVKEKQREESQNTNRRGASTVKKQSAGELRLHKDISELNLPKSCKISFPNGKNDLMNFEVTIKPDEGYYMNGKFVFTFQVSNVYPHEAPKVKCKTKVMLSFPSFRNVYLSDMFIQNAKECQCCRCIIRISI
ncbi:Ubiquitin-conjugating enzyme E2 [Arabidopsis thaliana x Arabidopsis arenosa]|uniref:Ubiquitin-conjugating enzyme E2 n=1 Tax=Arabidopsis thaliana x Arabidopsis arenosa TaxID=1240361 RepID=A0A8T2AZ77_9BRAS|nr:Ubiquitin-conjugating enzyme E2 [Arabidopsis thaliana x Arabidopsis arenosa]